MNPSKEIITNIKASYKRYRLCRLYNNREEALFERGRIEGLLSSVFPGKELGKLLSGNRFDVYMTYIKNYERIDCFNLPYKSVYHKVKELEQEHDPLG